VYAKTYIGLRGDALPRYFVLNARYCLQAISVPSSLSCVIFILLKRTLTRKHSHAIPTPPKGRETAAAPISEVPRSVELGRKR
jgi:hypothetical protein